MKFIGIDIEGNAEIYERGDGTFTVIPFTKARAMDQKRLFEELGNDYEEYIKKAVRHGEHAAVYVLYGNHESARSHARLAASHARRAIEIESQMTIVAHRVWNESDAPIAVGVEREVA